jgi:hypothetical protein
MIAIVSLILLVVTVVIAVWTLVLMRKQDKRETNAEEWTVKFYRAAELATKVHSGLLPPDVATWGLMFPAELQDRITFYLISISSSHPTAQVRPLVPEQLSMPAMRQTITDVLKRVEKIKRDNPDGAKTIGL